MMNWEKIFYLIILNIGAIGLSHAQTSGTKSKITGELYAAYGIFNFINVDELSAYQKGNDTKLISAGIRLNLNPTYSIGILASYQKLELKTNGSQDIYFVEREYYMSRLDKTLLFTPFYELYVSALSGIEKETRHLVLGDETNYQPVWGIILLGIRLKIGKHYNIYAESAYSKAAVLRFGLGYKF